MLKQKKIVLLFNLIIVAILIIILSVNIISAQMCNVEDVKNTLRKALFDYLPSPKLSKLNPTEIKDILDFYLNSSNLTSTKCDIKATLSNISYDVIINEFLNLTANITIPYCGDGTHYGQCSITKPLYCFAGQLVNRCRKCGCPFGQECQIDERAAFTINEGRWGKCVLAIKDKNVTILEDFDGDGINETLTNTGIIGNEGNISSFNVIVFLTNEGDIKEDLNNDGDIMDYILRYYNINTGELVNTKMSVNVGKIGGISISNNIIAFSSYEGGIKEDLNNDGDIMDYILRYYNINTGELVNTKIALGWIGDISISNNIIAFLASDKILRYYNINTKEIVSVNTEIDLGRLGDGFISISNNIIVFLTNEGNIEKDLNNDGDTNDRVLRYYDINTDRLVNTKIVLEEGPTSISNNIIAFSTYEYYVGDLNNDGDISDVILRYYDINTDRLVNTRINVNKRDISISNNIIAFLTNEGDIKEDLNNDGDISDVILRYYDINTDRLVNTRIVLGDGSISISNNIIAFSTYEYYVGDLNNDGDTNDRVLRYLTLSKYSIERPQNISCTFSGCSVNKPKYCLNGTLINNCSLCSCLANQTCQTDGTCAIIETISNLSDGSTEKNITFNETGNQTIYVEVPPGANVTNATVDVTSNVTNLSLDVGSDGDIQFTTNETDKTETTPDLSPEINEYIINSNNQSNQTSNITGGVIYTDSGHILVPLTFYSDSAGVIKISNININYITEQSSIEESSLFEKTWSYFILVVILGIIILIVYLQKNKKKKPSKKS